MHNRFLKYFSIILILCIFIAGCDNNKNPGQTAGKSTKAAKEPLSDTSVYKPQNTDGAERKISNISWPDGQALPTFSLPAPRLDTLDIKDLSQDDQVSFASLQGLVNMEQPRIFITKWYTWSQTFKFNLNSYNAANKYSLFEKYKDHIKGLVVYSPEKSVHYRNLASTIANIKGYIPVTQDFNTAIQSNVIIM